MDNIVLLNPTDIISESMEKINYNFNIIKTNEDVTDYKLSQFSKSYKSDLKELRDLILDKELGINRNIGALNERLTDIPGLDNIQNAINAAISGAQGNLEDFIIHTAGQQITNALAPYAKTSDIINADYVTSAAFNMYKSNAEQKTASMSLIVANATFYKDSDGKLVYKDGTSSSYSTIEAYYKDLATEDREYVDGSSDFENKLQDPDVIYRLTQLCEKRVFKLVSTELASISTAVEDGVSSTAIVNAVKGTPGAENDGDIVAAIFMDANARTGQSSMTLNANNFKINSDNFKVNVDGDHKVVVKGELEATKLTINGCNLADPNGAREFVQAYQSHDGGEGGSSDYEPYDDGWLTGAFSKTEVDGGLLLAGNLLVGNSEGNVTAGMMGASTSGNDLRFFAGSDVEGSSNAPFRVCEDGSLYTTKAQIGGDSVFSGTISYPFNNMLSSCELDYYYQSGTIPCNQVAGTWPGSSTDPNTGDYYQVPYGTFYRHIKNGFTSFLIPYTSRYHGNAYSYYGRVQYITLPQNLGSGVVINILANGNNYKNIMRPVHIIAPSYGKIYYETVESDSEYIFGNSINDTSELIFRDVFYLRLLCDGDNNFYVVQILGKYTTGDGNVEPDKTRSDYVGVVIDNHPERQWMGSGYII